MKTLSENGVGSNLRTIDNNPISHFNDKRISVEMYPSAWGKVSASVACDEIGFNSGVREFNTEAEANHFAVNTYDRLKAKLNALQEAIISRLLQLS